VKFRVKIDEHDFQFKKRNAERFLLEGNKVKSTVIFRGREMVHSEIGRRILVRLADDLKEVASIESSPRQEGMTMVQILTPRKELAVGKKSARKGDEGKKGKKELPAGVTLKRAENE
jgi:translation initiation factor IF-3